MKPLLSNISLQVNEHVYLKDPDSSVLGQKIVRGSIELLDELGFEDFNFKKLAEHISSTEASVYRYFESKHKLLLYLTGWYWNWMEYRLVFAVANIEDPWERLDRAISLLCEQIVAEQPVGHIDVVKLNQIVISESSKAYLTKMVDDENKYGVFGGYKQLVARVSEIIEEINPSYKYPHMLVSTLVEGAHLQRFFAAHLPRLTDIIEGEDCAIEFSRSLVRKAIEPHASSGRNKMGK